MLVRSYFQKFPKFVLLNIAKLGIWKEKIYDACQFGKQMKSSFKLKKYSWATKPLQFLHIDLFGPCRIASLSGKYYAFIIVLFLNFKDEALNISKHFCNKVQNEKGYNITTSRGDHGEEFDNIVFDNFSTSRTRQQNSVGWIIYYKKWLRLC